MLVMKSLNFGITGFALLIPVHWLCDLVWLSFVSILVYRTRSLWGRKFQEGLFITCGLLLIDFGVWFVVSGLQPVVYTPAIWLCFYCLPGIVSGIIEVGLIL